MECKEFAAGLCCQAKGNQIVKIFYFTVATLSKIECRILFFKYSYEHELNKEQLIVNRFSKPFTSQSFQLFRMPFSSFENTKLTHTLYTEDLFSLPLTLGIQSSTAGTNKQNPTDYEVSPSQLFNNGKIRV